MGHFDELILLDTGGLFEGFVGIHPSDALARVAQHVAALVALGLGGGLIGSQEELGQRQLLGGLLAPTGGLARWGGLDTFHGFHGVGCNRGLHRLFSLELAGRSSDRPVDLLDPAPGLRISAGSAPALVDLGGRRQFSFRDLGHGELLDAQEVPVLGRGDEGDGHARPTHPAGAPDAVHVGFRVLRHVEVDHVSHVADVQPPGGHVGRDQVREALIPKPVHDLVALSLGKVAVQPFHVVAEGLQFPRELVDVTLGAAEDDGAGAFLLIVEESRESIDLLVLGHLVEDLLGFLQGQRLRHHRHRHRIPHVVPGDALDVRGDGGREEQSLAIRGALPNDAPDIGQKAHVQHHVGFVQHQHLDRVQRQRTPAEVIEDASRRSDDDLHTLLESRDLPVDALAPVHGQDFVPREQSELVHLLGDLHGQLPRGRKYQRLHDGTFIRQEFRHGYAEGRGLARARLGLT